LTAVTIEGAADIEPSATRPPPGWAVGAVATGGVNVRPDAYIRSTLRVAG
jgi:hypothetical protein